MRFRRVSVCPCFGIWRCHSTTARETPYDTKDTCQCTRREVKLVNRSSYERTWSEIEQPWRCTRNELSHAYIGTQILVGCLIPSCYLISTMEPSIFPDYNTPLARYLLHIVISTPEHALSNRKGCLSNPGSSPNQASRFDILVIAFTSFKLGGAFVLLPLGYCVKVSEGTFIRRKLDVEFTALDNKKKAELTSK